MTNELQKYLKKILKDLETDIKNVNYNNDNKNENKNAQIPSFIETKQRNKPSKTDPSTLQLAQSSNTTTSSEPIATTTIDSNDNASNNNNNGTSVSNYYKDDSASIFGIVIGAIVGLSLLIGIGAIIYRKKYYQSNKKNKNNDNNDSDYDDEKKYYNCDENNNKDDKDKDKGNNKGNNKDNNSVKINVDNSFLTRNNVLINKDITNNSNNIKINKRNNITQYQNFKKEKEENVEHVNRIKNNGSLTVLHEISQQQSNNNTYNEEKNEINKSPKIYAPDTHSYVHNHYNYYNSNDKRSTFDPFEALLSSIDSPTLPLFSTKSSKKISSINKINSNLPNQSFSQFVLNDDDNNTNDNYADNYHDGEEGREDRYYNYNDDDVNDRSLKYSYDNCSTSTLSTIVPQKVSLPSPHITSQNNKSSLPSSSPSPSPSPSPSSASTSSIIKPKNFSISDSFKMSTPPPSSNRTDDSSNHAKFIIHKTRPASPKLVSRLNNDDGTRIINNDEAIEDDKVLFVEPNADSSRIDVYRTSSVYSNSTTNSYIHGDYVHRKDDYGYNRNYNERINNNRKFTINQTKNANAAIPFYPSSQNISSDAQSPMPPVTQLNPRPQQLQFNQIVDNDNSGNGEYDEYDGRVAFDHSNRPYNDITSVYYRNNDNILDHYNNRDSDANKIYCSDNEEDPDYDSNDDSDKDDDEEEDKRYDNIINKTALINDIRNKIEIRIDDYDNNIPVSTNNNDAMFTNDKPISNDNVDNNTLSVIGISKEQRKHHGEKILTNDVDNYDYDNEIMDNSDFKDFDKSEILETPVELPKVPKIIVNKNLSINFERFSLFRNAPGYIDKEGRYVRNNHVINNIRNSSRIRNSGSGNGNGNGNGDGNNRNGNSYHINSVNNIKSNAHHNVIKPRLMDQYKPYI